VCAQVSFLMSNFEIVKSRTGSSRGRTDGLHSCERPHLTGERCIGVRAGQPDVFASGDPTN
ncbi:MAG: hypothetical protein WAL86_08815, partial [Candidatus Acidiferrales bacterium]